MSAHKTSYLLFAAFAAVALYFHFSSEVLAGLFSYLILDITHQKLSRKIPASLSSWISVAIFIVLSVALSWLFTIFVELAVTRLPVLLSAVLPSLNALADKYGISLPFGNIQDLRALAISEITQNVESVTKASGLLTRGFVEILASVFTAILFHLYVCRKQPSVKKKIPPNLFAALAAEFDARVRLFMVSFEKIFWIQILLVIFRTGLIALFLLVVRMPWLHFLLLASFILGIIPVFGAFVSSSLVVGAALGVSPHLAVLTLIFLLLLHQAEYLLYSRLAGSEFAIPTWQILLGLLIGEKIMGVPGMILAPAVIHYVREELRACPMPLDAP